MHAISPSRDEPSSWIKFAVLRRNRSSAARRVFPVRSELLITSIAILGTLVSAGDLFALPHLKGTSCPRDRPGLSSRGQCVDWWSRIVLSRKVRRSTDVGIASRCQRTRIRTQTHGLLERQGAQPSPCPLWVSCGGLAVSIQTVCRGAPHQGAAIGAERPCWRIATLCKRGRARSSNYLL